MHHLWPCEQQAGPLPASTPWPLPTSHLSGMLQDSIDQCLQNAPEKNGPVAKCLSHPVSSPFAPTGAGITLSHTSSQRGLFTNTGRKTRKGPVVSA